MRFTLLSLVTLAHFGHTWRGKVHCVSLFRDQGSVSNRELGQIFRVNTHIMQTQLNPRADVNFPTRLVNNLVLKVVT